MKGKDILNKVYNVDEEKFRNAIYDTQNQIELLTITIKKFQDKKIKFEKSLEKYKNMDLSDWLKEHPKQ